MRLEVYPRKMVQPDWEEDAGSDETSLPSSSFTASRRLSIWGYEGRGQGEPRYHGTWGAFRSTATMKTTSKQLSSLWHCVIHLQSSSTGNINIINMASVTQYNNIKSEIRTAWSSTHHLVDFLDGLAHATGLEACSNVGLQKGTVVHPLVKVIAPDLGHVLWEGGAWLQHRLHRHRGGMVCHGFIF